MFRLAEICSSHVILCLMPTDLVCKVFDSDAVISSDCLAVLCPVPNCPNPIPPSPGECCARCRQGNQKCDFRFVLQQSVLDCRLVRCARPNCENPIIPPGECCGICPLSK